MPSFVKTSKPVGYNPVRTLGQIAYEEFMSGSVAVTWTSMDEDGRNVWEQVAQAVLAAAPVKEKLPEHYLDVMATNMTVEQMVNGDAMKLHLEAYVPAVESRNRNAGSTRHILSDIHAVMQARTHKLRLSVITDAEIQAELSRLDPEDGTVRELLPEEATW
jgi:hypothetical protein